MFLIRVNHKQVKPNCWNGSLNDNFAKIADKKIKRIKQEQVLNHGTMIVNGIKDGRHIHQELDKDRSEVLNIPKKTNSAERIRPTPMLNNTRQQTECNSRINFLVKVILSRIQKTKKTQRVKPKLISVWTFFENRKIYFGTLTFVKIPDFPIRDCIPCPVDSLKQEKTKFPQKR